MFSPESATLSGLTLRGWDHLLSWFWMWDPNWLLRGKAPSTLLEAVAVVCGCSSEPPILPIVCVSVLTSAPHCHGHGNLVISWSWEVWALQGSSSSGFFWLFKVPWLPRWILKSFSRVRRKGCWDCPGEARSFPKCCLLLTIKSSSGLWAASPLSQALVGPPLSSQLFFNSFFSVLWFSVCNPYTPLDTLVSKHSFFLVMSLVGWPSSFLPFMTRGCRSAVCIRTSCWHQQPRWLR